MFVIHHPRHTQKSFKLHENRQYTFMVDPRANKVEIKKKIESMYNVVVMNLNTANYRGKRVSRYTRKRVIEGQRPNYKKAIVTLKEGDIIDINKDIL